MDTHNTNNIQIKINTINDNTDNIVDNSKNTINDNTDRVEKCYELEQIKYKSNRLNHKTISNTTNDNVLSKSSLVVDETSLQHILNKTETNTNPINKPWTKLTKNEKKTALKVYSATQKNSEKLLNFLYECLDKQKFKKAKEIDYDINTGRIKRICNLKYNKTRKMFTIRNKDDKKDLTLKISSKKRKKSIK